MTRKHLVAGFAVTTFLVMPLYGQVVQPGDAGDVTALDVIEEHEAISTAYEIFGTAFEERLDGDEGLAFFAPTDEALAEADVEDISDAELESLFNRHLATGLAAEAPLEFIEWFGTMDGTENTVSVENGTVILNDSASVVEAIPAENGVVYIIDQPLYAY